MHTPEIALLRRKHAEYLHLEAVARRRAASMSDLDEQRAWKTLAQSWRELATQVEAITGVSAVAAASTDAASASA